VSVSDFLRRLFDPAPGPPSAVYLAPVALFLVVFLGCAVVYLLRRALFPGMALNARIARRFSTYGMIVGAVGLVLLAARYLGIYWLEMRFLLVLAGLSVVAVVAYLLWYLRVRYPADRASYERARERERFVRPGAHSARRRARRQRR
jgi:hypothetical protein